MAVIEPHVVEECPIHKVPIEIDNACPVCLEEAKNEEH